MKFPLVNEWIIGVLLILTILTIHRSLVLSIGMGKYWLGTNLLSGWNTGWFSTSGSLQVMFEFQVAQGNLTVFFNKFPRDTRNPNISCNINKHLVFSHAFPLCLQPPSSYGCLFSYSSYCSLKYIRLVHVHFTCMKTCCYEMIKWPLAWWQHCECLFLYSSYIFVGGGDWQ